MVLLGLIFMYTIAWYGKRGGRHTFRVDSLHMARAIAAGLKDIGKRHVVIIEDGNIIQDEGFAGTKPGPRPLAIELGD